MHPLSRAALVVAALVTALVGRRVFAQAECPPSARPVVLFTAHVRPPDEVIAEALREHLLAQLTVREIDLCDDRAPGREPIAHVTLDVERPANGSVSAVIRILDQLTEKRVERTIDLTSMPDDSRALAVAVAADELLRASWAELHVLDAPEPSQEPPTEVLTALAQTMRNPADALPSAPESAAEPSTWEWELGLAATGLFFEHLEAFGGRAHAGWWPHPHLAIYVELDFSFSLRRGAPTGSARAERQGGYAGLEATFVPNTEMWGAGADAAVGVLRMAFVPRADPGGAPVNAEHWTLEARAGLRGWLLLAPIRFTLAARAVVAIRPATAIDEGATVLSNDRIGAEVTIGTAVVF